MDIDDLKKIVNDFATDMIKNNSRSFKREVNTEKIKGVIDISLDDEAPVPKEKFDTKPIIKDYRYWILKLDRYYKTPAMRVAQLNTSSLKIYAKLCETLEIELNKMGTTVARLQSQLRREGLSYDIYYTLYAIAETAVINHYNPMSEKSADRSYRILEKYTSLEIKNIIQDRVDELEAKLTAPTDETREYYKLTDNNMVSLWWDPDGSLRAKYGFSKKEQKAIDQLSKRTNVLWKNTKVYDILMDMYLATIREVVDNDEIATDRLLNIISPYNKSKSMVDSMMIVSEARLREYFSFFSQINTDKAASEIEEYDGGGLAKFIETFQNEYLLSLDKNMIDEIYLEYFSQNPSKYQELAKYIVGLDKDKQIEILETYKTQTNFEKLLNYLVKNYNDELGILPLAYIFRYGYNKPSNEKALREFIHPENIEEFIQRVVNTQISSDLLDELSLLKNKKLKKIDINRKKLTVSKSDLENTVNLVNEFMDEDIQEEEPIEEKVIEDSSVKYADVLSQIIAEGYIKVDQMADMAKEAGLTMNAFINQINDSLLDYIGDQTLLVEGDVIIIDEFYVDMIKELLDGN